MQKEIKIASKSTLDKVKEAVDNLADNASSGCITPPLNMVSSVSKVQSSVSTLPYEFYGGSAVLFKGEIHIFGGIDTSMNINTNHYKWDGSKWNSVSTLPYGISLGIALVLNDKIHLFGNIEYYDDVEKETVRTKGHLIWDDSEWTLDTNFNFYSINVNTAVIYDNYFYFISDRTIETDSEYGETVSVLYKYDGEEFTEVSQSPNYDLNTSQMLVYNNEIHFLGDNVDPFTHHYKWDGKEWSELDSIPYHLGLEGKAIVYNGEIHILGGGDSTSTVKCHYKFKGTTWTRLEDLPVDFLGSSAVVLNDEIHLLGSVDTSTMTIQTTHYRIKEAYKKMQPLFLFKGCTLSNHQTLHPIQNCAYENDVLTVTEDGIVEIGVETTENTVTLSIGGGS